MKYHQRLKKVIEFVGLHLDEEISLKSLSDKFHISEFHFHRLFTAFTGLSLMQYIRWLRLKRAARQLIVNKDQAIINIAINAGFESHEAFSRAFKKACGFSPYQYKQGFGRTYWENMPFCLPRYEDTQMKVDIKNVDKIRLAVIEHRGDPNLMIDSVSKLASWAKEKSIPFKPGAAFAIVYDDPKSTPADKFRIDFGIKIPMSLKIQGVVVEKYLPAGRYAVAMHHGSRDNIGDTVYSLYRDWLPNTDEELGDFPCVFCYLNFEHEVAETEQLTECWLLLK